jgi:hypothetical protein
LVCSSAAHFRLLRFQEKLGEVVESRFGNPTFDALPGLAGANQPGPGQLLEMMRNGRLANTQPLAQFAHADAGALPRIAAVPLATARETEKNREPVRMRKGLEGDGGFSDIHLSIAIDISKLCQEHLLFF